VSTPSTLERLESERAEVGERIDAIRAELVAMHASTVDSNVDDEHDPEGSTVALERAQLDSLLDQATQHLSEIDAATERIAVGEYGTCERCREAIAAERLAALPSTRYCVECAAILQRRT
jgi:RNA polymerase-binding transcription factor DksA